MQFSVGDAVRHEEFGNGRVCNTDPESRFMTYFLRFENGSVAWFSTVRAASELQAVS